MLSDNYTPTKTLGNGIADTFTFSWNGINLNFVRVFFENVATGVITEQLTGFVKTLEVNPADGGQVVFTTPPTSDEYVIVGRTTPKAQTDPYTTSKGFPAATVESNFDKLVAMLQESVELSGRSLVYPLGTDLSGAGYLTEIPLPSALQYLRWDATGKFLENFEPTTTTTDYPGTLGMGLDASKPASPSAGDVYIATDTLKAYVCYVGGLWRVGGMMEIDPLTSKATPDDDDIFVIEDNTGAKFKVRKDAIVDFQIKADVGDATPGYLGDKIDTRDFQISASDELQLSDDVSRRIQRMQIAKLQERGIQEQQQFIIGEDGNCYAVGYNNNAQLGIGALTTARTSWKKVAFPYDAGNVAKVYAGYRDTFFLMEDGDVYACGVNTGGQLGQGDITARDLPTKISGLSNVVKLVVSQSSENPTTCFAITSSDALYGWGYNTQGQLGLGDLIDKTTPQLISGSWQDVAINCSNGGTSIAIKTDGTLWTAGNDAVGETGQGTPGTDRPTWTQVGTVSDADSCYAWGANAVGSLYYIDTSGNVFGTGANTQGQLGVGDLINRSSFTQALSITNVVQLEGRQEGNNTVCARLSDGTIRAWGENGTGQCGDGTLVDISTPYNPSLSDIEDVMVVGTTGTATATIIARENDGGDTKIHVCGYNATYQLGKGDAVAISSFEENKFFPQDIVEMSHIGYTTACGLCYLTSDGFVLVHGNNASSQLGIDELVADQPVPTFIRPIY